MKLYQNIALGRFDRNYYKTVKLGYENSNISSTMVQIKTKKHHLYFFVPKYRINP